MRLSRLLLIVVAFASLPDAANSTPAVRPFRPGQMAGDLEGLGGFSVAREILNLDLRPLADNEPAIVTATYHLRHVGPERRLTCTFMIDKLESTAPEVWLDKKPIKPVESKDPTPESSWKAPASTPGLDDNQFRSIDYQVLPHSLGAFNLALPAGAHVLRVRYLVKLSAFSGKAPVCYRQLAFVQTPAREWKDFGGLDLTVELPPDWHAATNFPLKRAGDRLTGHFAQIPGEAFTFTVQVPYHWLADQLSFIWVWLFFAVSTPLVIGFLAALAGFCLGRLGRSSAWAWPLSLIFGLLWMGLQIGSMLVVGLRTVPEHEHSWTNGNLIGFLILYFILLLLSLVALPLGLFLAQYVTWLVALLVPPANRAPST